MDAKIDSLEPFRESYLDSRQGIYTTWVRDVVDKGIARRLKDIERLHEGVVSISDIRCDAMLVTERCKKNSTEWQTFCMLYGLTPDDFKKIGIITNSLETRSSLIYSRQKEMLWISTDLE
jgi:hypothetical protein